MIKQEVKRPRHVLSPRFRLGVRVGLAFIFLALLGIDWEPTCHLPTHIWKKLPRH